MGDNSVESFAGSQADLESAADHLFTSPPRPQPLAFKALSLRAPAKAREVLEISARHSTRSKHGCFPGKYFRGNEVPPPPPPPPSRWTLIMAQCYLHASRVYEATGHNVNSVGEPSRLPSAKPKKFSHSFKQYDVVPSSPSDHYSDQSDNPRPAPSRAKNHTDKSKHNSRSRYLPSSSEEDQSSELRHRSPKPSRKTYTDQDHPQHDPDPPYYKEVALSDIPSQYAEEVDTFRRIFKLPDPRDSLPKSSTVVMGLDDEKGRQELRPRSPSSMLPLNSIIKDAFDKFDQDFQEANLPEGKYIKAPPSTAKWYKVGQPCYEDKIQELNTDFAKILSPLGPLWARFPYQFSKNWNTGRDRISPHLTLLPPLPRLLPAIPLWKSASIV